MYVKLIFLKQLTSFSSIDMNKQARKMEQKEFLLVLNYKKIYTLTYHKDLW